MSQCRFCAQEAGAIAARLQATMAQMQLAMALIRQLHGIMAAMAAGGCDVVNVHEPDGEPGDQAS